jgi:hypothetical protein
MIYRRVLRGLKAFSSGDWKIADTMSSYWARTASLARLQYQIPNCHGTRDNFAQIPVASQAKLDFGERFLQPSLRGETRTMNIVPFGGING